MAHSLRQPLFKAVGFSSSVIRRCFSQIPPLRAGPAGAAAQAQQPRSRQQADRSIRVASKEMGGKIPSDMGILDSASLSPPSLIAISNAIANSVIHHTNWPQSPLLDRLPCILQITTEACLLPVPRPSLPLRPQMGIPQNREKLLQAKGYVQAFHRHAHCRCAASTNVHFVCGWKSCFAA